MILEFSISNYRSICEKQSFAMIASGAKSRPNNIFDVDLNNGSNVKLTKTAGIFGANASGKSNVIRALFEIRMLIVDSRILKIDRPIPAYDPFLFNTKSNNEPVEFEIIFLSKDKKKYQYKLAFNQHEIVEESLHHFPSIKSQIIFNRGKEKDLHDENIHIGKLGKNFNYKKYKVYKKIPLLSIFGQAENYHTDISPVFTFFDEIEIWNVTESGVVRRLAEYVKEFLQESDNKVLVPQIEELIRQADTQIQALLIDDTKRGEREVNTVLGEPISTVRRREILYGEHNVYERNNIVAKHNLPFFNESFGTNKLFALGGLIVKTINQGGVIFFDELDSSFHPLVTKLLVNFFQESNLSNAQLIFTTHETYLLNKEFRSDQIWFTQKKENGQTELFSAQDFDGVREDIPFEKWYLGGKFGAIPYITKGGHEEKED
ncbi:AAA family ATPase [Flavobacterium hungaricum]|uniref:ATP-binding protein n=1 Tax=Flavobacterium hungaricum TaxID=2082725 RepID=A0ABR9TDW7_9FLAO|nr:ATP-binding protein [Flavobacterium hungaricum]MBE8723530.1 ATP-binding protein [Flavobacterium hungaricum]